MASLAQGGAARPKNARLLEAIKNNPDAKARASFTFLILFLQVSPISGYCGKLHKQNKVSTRVLWRDQRSF